MPETLFERMSKAQSQTDPIHSPDVLARAQEIACTTHHADTCTLWADHGGNDCDCDRPERMVLAALIERDSHAGVRDGYTDAFYELATMMNIPAQPLPPKVVWETQMRPRIAAAIRAMPLPDGVE